MLGINIIVILIFLLYIAWNTTTPSIAPRTLDSLQQQIIDWAIKTSDIVVQIVAEDTSTYYQEGNFDKSSLLEQKNVLKKWSGIIASKKWYILTNNHVVDNNDLKYSIVTSDGIVFPVRKIRKDDLIDIAILSIEISTDLPSEAKFIGFDNSVDVGQFVFAIGNALSEYPNTLSLGIISGKWRKVSVESNKNTYYAWLYQTDAALNPGNSWWPLVNLSGEVIGMITAISRGGNNIGFALPLTQSFIDTTLSLLVQQDILLRPYLWITYTDTATGARIDTIFSWSPVQWELMVGDTIIALDKRKISFISPLLYYLYTYKPGDTVIFTVARGDKILSFPIVLWQKTL